MNTRFSVLVTIIVALTVFTILPHPPNFSPVAAMALFGGAYFSDKRHAFLIPFLAMFISDLILGLHPSMVFVYGAFALTVAMGIWLRDRISMTTVAGAAVASSVLFYLITNFGVWIIGGWYPLTMEGLIACYVAAIPFFQNTLLGNLFFTILLFGGFRLLERGFPALSKAA